MGFMIMIKASKDSQAGKMASRQLLTEMGTFNEELTNAGVLLAAEGLQPSAKGACVSFSGNERSVIDGPCAETKEQIGGILLLDAKDLDHATESMSKHPGIRVATFEIRPIDEESTAKVNTTVSRRASDGARIDSINMSADKPGLFKKIN